MRETSQEQATLGAESTALTVDWSCKSERRTRNLELLLGPEAEHPLECRVLAPKVFNIIRIDWRC